MAITYGFYNSLNGDRKYNAQDMSRIFDGIINDGVFMSIGTAFIVQSTNSMIVNVGVGRAWFNGTWTHNDSILQLRIPDSDVLLNRIDTVVLEVNSNDNVRINTIKVVAGIPATEPTPPVLKKDGGVYQYPLANIAVNALVDEITQANITNKVGTSECPFVTGILQTMNIDALVAQWGQQWTEWKSAIEADNTSWSNRERSEFEAWCSEQQRVVSLWISDYESDLNLIKGDFVDFIELSESDFNAWFDTVKSQLSGDAIGNLQRQLEELTKREFERFYGMSNKTTTVNKSNGATISIVEVTNEATSTTTFSKSSSGTTITTTCIPTVGNYNYTKTVTIKDTSNGKQIVESFTSSPK